MDKANYREIGLNIHNLRRRAGLNQEELADLVGVTSQYISQIERAKKKVSLSVLIAISNSLNIDINLILGTNVKVKSSCLDEEMATLMAGASSDQKQLCLTICDAVIHYPDSALHRDRKRR